MSSRSSKSNRSTKSKPTKEPVQEPDQPLEVFNPEDLEESDLDELEPPTEQVVVTEEEPEDQEPEEEQPPEETIQVPEQQFHVILCRPDAYPRYEIFDYPHLAIRWIIDETRAAARLGELSSWRVFMFVGQAVEMAGDIATGELYVEHEGEYISAAQFDQENPPPILRNGQMIPSPRSSDSGPANMPGQSADMLGFDDSDSAW